MRRVFFPWTAREALRFIAVVVLPTPPFWFATAIVLPRNLPAISMSYARYGHIKTFITAGIKKEGKCFT
jgi:hypothetical protein